MCEAIKLKHTCGNKVNSRCVKYELPIPDFSDLSGEDCVTTEETTADLYQNTDQILSGIDLSNLGGACLDYQEEEPGNIKVNEVLLKLEEEVCALKDNEQSISGGVNLSNIDSKCLVDPCGNDFSTIEDLLQAIIDKVCELDTTVNG